MTRSAPGPTEICITVDTEFSIGGNFADPRLMPVAEPTVLGSIAGKEHGLGFLLDSLREFGMRATFFVETLQTTYFGDEPMGEIARRIARAEQDVQLHLHPCWLHYEAAANGPTESAPDDSCGGRTDAELSHFFKTGLAAFERWGLPRPIAVRAGNFQADMQFYHAADRFGFGLSSNVALAVEPSADPRLRLAGGRHRFGRVLELPVLSYFYPLGPLRRLRALAITACTVAEIVSVLRQARAQGISPVVVLTHPHEFIKRTDLRYQKLRRNRINQARFRDLLGFLHRNPNDFVVRPISAISDNTGIDGYRDATISVSAATALARIAENGVNDRIWWY